MSNQNFAKNLRTICNRYRSVAHVCRSLEMNRQQFNKYLSGKIYPAKYNLNRICQFFNLSEEQINLSPDAFQLAVADDVQHDVAPARSEIEKVINMLPEFNEVLARYEGYYYSHFHALGFPGYLVRSLVYIFSHKGRFYSNNTEHLWDKGKCDSQRNRFKYKGVVSYLGDRIFITEVEMLTKTTICHTILIPSYRNIVGALSGITTGVGSINSHMPKATRVEYQFLGKQVDLRKALRGCGLFKLESNQIDINIRERIDNEITDHEYMLTARDY